MIQNLKNFNLVLDGKPEIFKLVLTFWIWHNILASYMQGVIEHQKYNNFFFILQEINNLQK